MSMDAAARRDGNKRVQELLGYTITPNGNPAWEWLLSYPNGTARIFATEQLARDSRDVNFYGSLDTSLAQVQDAPGMAIQLFRNGTAYVVQLLLEGGDVCFEGRSDAGYAEAAGMALERWLVARKAVGK